MIPRREAIRRGTAALALSALLLLPAVASPSPHPFGATRPTTGLGTPSPSTLSDRRIPSANLTSVSNWTNLANFSTALAPPVRTGASLAFDPSLGAAVLYGGESANGTELGDTWTLGSNWSWSERNGSSAPSPRVGAAFGFDAASGLAILFGGESPNGSFLSDTWKFSATGWTLLSTTGSPSPRAFASFAGSPNGSGLVLFGGTGPSGPLNDTWYYHQGLWRNLTASAGPAPSPRWSAPMTLDPSRSFDLLFGGNGSSAVFDDTWAFNGTGWAHLPIAGPPVPRAAASLAYDGADGQTILFGGWAPKSGALAGTWAFNGTGWSAPSVAEPRPPARWNAGFTELTGFGGGVDLLFGGTGPAGPTFVASWIFGHRLPLLVAAPTAGAGPAEAGAPLTLTVNPVGGVTPYSYTWSGLPANCTTANAPTLPCVPSDRNGTYLTYSISVTVSDARSDRAVSLPLALVVAPALVAPRLVIYPASVALDQNLTIQVLASGGTPPYTVHYGPLPPGCSGGNLTVLVCRPTSAGSYSIYAVLTDRLGGSRTVRGTAVVEAAGTTVTLFDWVILAGLLATVAILAAVWVAARRSPPPRKGPAGRTGAEPSGAAAAGTPPPR